MKIKELQEKLNELGVPKSYYSLKKGMEEKFYLIKNKNQWEYFFLERGIKTDRNTFFSEDEACDFFLRYIKSREYEWSMWKTRKERINWGGGSKSHDSSSR